jgi:hypothetical protein
MNPADSKSLSISSFYHFAQLWDNAANNFIFSSLSEKPASGKKTCYAPSAGLAFKPISTIGGNW